MSSLQTSSNQSFIFKFHISKMSKFNFQQFKTPTFIFKHFEIPLFLNFNCFTFQLFGPNLLLGRTSFMASLLFGAYCIFLWVGVHTSLFTRGAFANLVKSEGCRHSKSSLSALAVWLWQPTAGLPAIRPSIHLLYHAFFSLSSRRPVLISNTRAPSVDHRVGSAQIWFRVRAGATSFLFSFFTVPISQSPIPIKIK